MTKHTKNEEYKVEIIDIGTNGEGICHLDDGYTLFITGAVIGDVVIARIIKPMKNYGIARVMQMISASPYRIKPMCEVSDKCGGCQIASLSYDKQLEHKQKKVRELLIRVGGFSAEHIDSVMNNIVGFYDEVTDTDLIVSNKTANGDCKLTGSTPCRFRNKAQYPVGIDNEGNIITGFYTIHSHRIIQTKDCLIGAKTDSVILNAIMEYMQKFHITAYDEKTGKGLIRHILIRTGYYTGEIMVCLVINGSSIPEKKYVIDKLCSLSIGVESICISPNTANTNVIMGDSYKVLWGKDYITDMIGDLSFRLSPLSFFQVNPVQTQKLYSLALSAANLTGEETVWDLYCGIGTISLFLARKAKKVYGIEIIPQAIENAKENAEINQITNVGFFVGKAEEVLPKYYNNPSNILDDSALTPDVIVVDPPRKGLDVECINTMLQMSPKRMVYVSCDPATLSRDLKILCESGKYMIQTVTPVDMFPNSSHVETVVLIQRKDM